MRPGPTASSLIAALLVLVLPAASASAQGAPPRKQPPKPAPQARKPLPSKPVLLPASRRPGRPGSFEVAASALWLGPGGAGSSAARLTSGQQGGTGEFTWFRAKGEYLSSTGVRALVAYNLTRSFAVEAGFAYSPSRIRFVASDDPELSSGFTSPGQRLNEYFFDAAAVVHLHRFSFSRGRGRPFVSAGAGYLRQLHTGNTLVETGQVYHAGGGVKYMLAPRFRGIVRAFGVRLDARVYVRSGGFGFTSEASVSPAVSAGLLAAF